MGRRTKHDPWQLDSVTSLAPTAEYPRLLEGTTDYYTTVLLCSLLQVLSEKAVLALTYSLARFE